MTPEALKNIIRTGHRLGWQMASHVTGDAGVDAVMDAVEAANADSPIRARRYNLVHAYFPNPETATRAARLGVAIDTQPAWLYKDGERRHAPPLPWRPPQGPMAPAFLRITAWAVISTAAMSCGPVAP